MDTIQIKQIIELIKTNPQLDYDQLKAQAIQAGVPMELFEEAWKASGKGKNKKGLKIIMIVLIFIIIGGSVFAFLKITKTDPDKNQTESPNPSAENGMPDTSSQPSKPKMHTISQTQDTLPKWVIDLGIAEPKGLILDSLQSKQTSSNDPASGYDSIENVYKGNLETAKNEAEKIAAVFSIPRNKDMEDIMKEMYAPNGSYIHYEDRNIGYGPDKAYLIKIIVAGQQPAEMEMMLSIINARQMDEKAGQIYEPAGNRDLDVSRKADLSNLSMALGGYKDEGYPGELGKPICMTKSEPIFTKLAASLKDGIPLPNNSETKTHFAGIDCVGSYLYLRLSDGPIIVSQMSTFTEANFDSSKELTIDSNSLASDLKKLLITSEDAQKVDPKNLLYIQLPE